MKFEADPVWGRTYDLCSGQVLEIEEAYRTYNLYRVERTTRLEVSQGVFNGQPLTCFGMEGIVCV